MPGWTHRSYFPAPPFFLPRGIHAPGQVAGHGPSRFLPSVICLLLTFFLATAARLLEIPFWDNLSYRLGEEYLLATHDTYHWIAGAEGFGRAVGHPMALLARFLAWANGTTPAVAGFWAPPFLNGLMAVTVFLWAWGLGRPFSGLCAGVLASLAPAYCARTLLGFYDTDLVIISFAVLVGLVPALWLHPWLAGLPEVIRDALARRRERKKAAGKGEKTPEQHPEKPGPDADSPWLFGQSRQPGAFLFSRAEAEHSMLTWPWLLMLVLSGFFGHSMQDWHSLFPYLVRFSALVPLLLIPVTGPRGGRSSLLAGALCYSFPLLLGWTGAIIGLVYAAALMLTRYSLQDPHDPPASPEYARQCPKEPQASWCWRLSPLSPDFRRALIRSRASLVLLWGLVLYVSLDAEVIEAMRRSFAAYVMRGGDVFPASAQLADPVVFPSVTLSIIEVQPISIQALFSYMYPLEVIALISLAVFAARLVLTPVFIWFVPLLAICFLSPKMGARMTLFGPPVLMLALCMEGGLLLESLGQVFRSLFMRGMTAEAASGPAGQSNSGKPATPGAAGRRAGLPPTEKSAPALAFATRLLLCLFCTALLATPLIRLIPDYTQGPIISREQAEGLAYLKTHSPKDSTVWNWWDWGYATHHFARRNTIADGALHGGASLFLPAAVYTTQDARTARQIIKHTAVKGDVAGNVFEGLSGSGAQQLMRDLADPGRPLINAPGKQYLVVSLELLRLGVWVSRYGSWNFESRQYAGALMNNLATGLTFNLDTGIILPQKEKPDPIYAASINVLEKRKLERTVYNRYGAYHFLFSTQHLEYRKRTDPLSACIYDIWRVLRPGHVFPGTLSDKLVMDEDFFNTMMVQLLLSSGDDPAIAPYFRLVFDNRFVKIYEVI